jgi:phosphoribosylformylglycinamidine cyclo-ligase
MTERMIVKTDYSSAGVNLEAADDAVSRIATLARSTYTSAVLAGVGPFSGLLKLELTGYREPVLVSSCDGVGTKLKLAIRGGHHQTIGADLVNHCVNDILTCGAQPLAFLDYVAIARMDPAIIEEVVTGIATACRENNVALIGGETAEMPGLYKMGDYDLAGFIVGMVERSEIYDGSQIAPGQMLIGIESSGPHTNGYSLIRRILFDINQYELEDCPDELGGVSLADAIMAVHRSYRGAVTALKGEVRMTGMAHITGGGIEGNLIRILPEGCQAVIDTGAWTPLPIFRFLQQTGAVDPEEMFRVFNMGIGYIAVIDHEDARRSLDILRSAGYSAYQIGHVVAGTRGVRLTMR